MSNQQSFNNGHWEDVTPDKPDNLISLEVGDSFVGVFVDRKENSDSKYGGFVYTLERESGDLASMFSTTNLDYSMRVLSSGDKIKISRLEDKPMPPPKKPLQVYKVQRWIEDD